MKTKMDPGTIGLRIARRRREKELSQAELAEMLHVTDKAISRWETGRGMPAVDLLKPLAEALDLSVDELLSGETDPGADGPQAADRSEGSGKIQWPYYLIAALLSVVLPCCIFQGKIHLNLGNVAILMPVLLAGFACGAAVSVILNLLRRGTVLCILAAGLLLLWFLMPGDHLLAPAVLGTGGLCCIGSIPCIASLLARVPRRRGVQQ